MPRKLIIFSSSNFSWPRQGSSLPCLRMLDPPLRTPLKPVENFQRTCLQSRLQTSSLRSNTKVSDPGTIFENTPFSGQKLSSAGGRVGPQNSFSIRILIFLLLRSGAPAQFWNPTRTPYTQFHGSTCKVLGHFLSSQVGAFYSIG